MEILLIRHGETALNAARVIQFPDTPLGPRGLEQAERLGRHLERRRIEHVLSSDYARARMTAEAICARTGAPLGINPRLRERNFGDMRGAAYASLGGIDLLAADYEPPGGESWADFHARVDMAWEEVLHTAATLETDLAVVTHGLVLRSLIERTLDGSLHAPAAGLVVANTSVTRVEPRTPWRILELASTAHLPDPLGDSAPV